MQRTQRSRRRAPMRFRLPICEARPNQAEPGDASIRFRLPGVARNLSAAFTGADWTRPTNSSAPRRADMTGQRIARPQAPATASLSLVRTAASAIAWCAVVRAECQPIAVQNVLHYLGQCLAVPETTGRVFEIGGADVLSHEALLQLMAEERGLSERIIIPVPMLTPFLSAL